MQCGGVGVELSIFLLGNLNDETVAGRVDYVGDSIREIKGKRRYSGINHEQTIVPVADDYQSAGEVRVDAPSPAKTRGIACREGIEPPDLNWIQRIACVEDTKSGFVLSFVDEPVVKVQVMVRGVDA